MLVIRQSQLQCFAAARRDAYMDALMAYLRAQFHAELWSLNQEELRHHVETALRHAANFGIVGERNCRRYLNLAVWYGWDFHARAETAWMRNVLGPDQPGTPESRLHHLVSRCIRRAEIAERNFRLGRARHAEGGASAYPELRLLKE
ncbi:hypothetical protein [Duganella vulcania]|uniref:Uncharacterized protein n=1 Tax=Duganella vulcania TaxID=2692166 RepID=A0A845GSP8_9BURK|nr:hypothetical protein [Duganella vulcania]MYM96256.1 hypothetical protein [Duganella vulcania]